MGNTITFRVDVLASSPSEINAIEAALQQADDELLKWLATRENKPEEEIAASLNALVCFKPQRNLEWLDSSLNRARRFENEFKDRYWGIVMNHLQSVSAHFPTAIFLCSYFDCQLNYAAQRVLRDGATVRCLYDDKCPDQSANWVAPDIFAPYWAEYRMGLEFGSLWEKWLIEMSAAIDELKGATEQTRNGCWIVTASLIKASPRLTHDLGY